MFDNFRKSEMIKRRKKLCYVESKNRRSFFVGLLPLAMLTAKSEALRPGPAPLFALGA
jgi:hypothetical protein